MRVFISYKRNSNPDEPVAMEVFRALQQEHDVFIDQTIPVGARWAERIEVELHQADFVIPFLSARCVHSEMVEAEIETAHRLAKIQNGRPRLLPVRLAYHEPLQYPLSAYLNGINWAVWEGPQDTPRLIEELLRAISGDALAPVSKDTPHNIKESSDSHTIPQPLPAAQLEMPEGTVDPQSVFYVERSSDTIALETICKQGVTIPIKGPRQMGKSSLLVRIGEAAATAGKRVVLLDFQLVDQKTLDHSDLFFRQFCAWVTNELDLQDRVDEFWKLPLGNPQRCARYFKQYLLTELSSPLVLAMDEVESIFDTGFRSDFFSMLRSWHNSRAIDPLWKNLDLVLVTSTEPYQLVANLNQSPFNVGQVIEVEDFSLAQVSELNRRHGSPLTSAEEEKLMILLAGHPYLIRRALYLIASQQITPSDLFRSATEDRGPFGDHLRYHLFRLHDKQELVRGLQEILKTGKCHNERLFFRLHGAGLVRREGHRTFPRCPLYADYLRERLHA